MPFRNKTALNGSGHPSVVVLVKIIRKILRHGSSLRHQNRLGTVYVKKGVHGMREVGWMAIVAMCASSVLPVVAAQQKLEKPVNPAHLKLTMEVAATTEEGYPSVLRVTVKNVGNVAVDMPMPVVGCLPHGGHVSMHLEWRPNQSKNGDSKGWEKAAVKARAPV